MGRVNDTKRHLTPGSAYLNPEDTVRNAAELMELHSTNILPVVERGKIIGTVMLRDLELALSFKNGDLDVRKVMSNDPYLVGPTESISRVFRNIELYNRDHAIVQDFDGKIIGTLSTRDALRILNDVLTFADHSFLGKYVWNQICQRSEHFYHTNNDDSGDRDKLLADIW